MLKKRIGSEKCSKLRQHQKRRWRQEFRSQTRSPRVGRSELKQHCFPPILPLIPPKPTLCPDWMPSLARSFTRETFRRDEKLKPKGVRQCIRVDDRCAPLDVHGVSCSVQTLAPLGVLRPSAIFRVKGSRPTSRPSRKSGSDLGPTRRRRRRYAVSSNRFGRRKIGRVPRKGWRNRLPDIGGYSQCPEKRPLPGHHRA